MFLVDTSVWINFFKGHSTKASLYLKSVVPTIRVATCPVIVQEILQGIKTDSDFVKMKLFFKELHQLTNEQYELSIEAAIIYRKLRKDGITIRKLNDCLIAAYAIKNKLPLLHDDKDFEYIATKSDLEIVKFA